MTFKAILQALREGGRLKFIDATNQFLSFFIKKIRFSPNLESCLHMRMEK